MNPYQQPGFSAIGASCSRTLSSAAGNFKVEHDMRQLPRYSTKWRSAVLFLQGGV
jgi:hypothetical protein